MTVQLYGFLLIIATFFAMLLLYQKMGSKGVIPIGLIIIIIVFELNSDYLLNVNLNLSCNMTSLVSSNASYIVTLSDKNSSLRYNAVLKDNETVAKITKEIKLTPYNYYDIMNLTYHPRGVSFVEYLHYVTDLGRTGIDIDAYTGSIAFDEKTTHIVVDDTLKSSVVDSKPVYHIGDYTFTGNDEGNLIATLSNNTRVKLDIVYDNSLGDISKYKILNAETLE